MTIEIHELVIRASVRDTAAPSSRAAVELSPVQVERIIDACLRRISRTMNKRRRKGER